MIQQAFFGKKKVQFKKSHIFTRKVFHYSAFSHLHLPKGMNQCQSTRCTSYIQCQTEIAVCSHRMAHFQVWPVTRQAVNDTLHGKS